MDGSDYGSSVLLSFPKAHNKVMCFSCISDIRPGQVSSRHTEVVLSPHRTACTTAATARKGRVACVLQSPPMSTPVQLQESRSVDGGRLSVVSREWSASL